MNALYESFLETVGSDGNEYPRGAQYSLSTNLNGASHDLIDIQAFVSDIDNLAKTYQQQLKSTKEEEKLKQNNVEKEGDQAPNSKNIIKLLQMKFGKQEQLEGVLRLSLGEAERYFTFNNHTIEQLPKSKYKSLSVLVWHFSSHLTFKRQIDKFVSFKI